VTCGIYQHDVGLELRASFENGDVVCTRVTPNIEEARLVANGWLDAVLEQGGFEQLADLLES